MKRVVRVCLLVVVFFVCLPVDRDGTLSTDDAARKLWVVDLVEVLPHPYDVDQRSDDAHHR